MPELSSLNAADVIAACEAGSAQAAILLSSALEIAVSMKVGEAASLSADSLPEELSGPGLVLLFCQNEAAAIAVMPESSGLLPTWCASPDVAASAKLRILAKELSSVFLPAGFEPTEVAAAYVESLVDIIGRNALPDEPTLVPCTLTREDGSSGTLHLIWPVTRVETVYGALGLERPASHIAEVTLVADHSNDGDKSVPGHQQSVRPRSSTVNSVDDLPPYARSLLRIEVPVMVNLATKRQSVGRILELGIGAIIQFDKSCDELLDLYVGNQRIAQGEAVKVGEKFGIRITSIALPDERFERVGKR